MVGAYGVHWLSYMPSLSVQAVKISGVRELDADLVKAFVHSVLEDGTFHYVSQKNIFFVPKARIETGITAAFPRALHARVERESLFSQQLEVIVKEREAYAKWCLPEQASAEALDCYALDGTGFIFARVATTSTEEFTTSQVFMGGSMGEPIGTVLTNGNFAELVGLLESLRTDANLIPTIISILPDEDFSIAVAQGFFVKASFGQDAASLTRNLELILSSDVLKNRVDEIEYVDLRFGNRVYYKMKGEELENT